MDTIGLLAAWVGVVSFLVAIVMIGSLYLLTSPLSRWWAKTSPARKERRVRRLVADVATSEFPDTSYLSDLVSLYGITLLTLVSAVAVVIVSILILDLGPALLASALPFNVDSKLITRFTGVFLFLACYLFIFRLSYLAVKIRLRTLPRIPAYVESARRELAELRRHKILPADALSMRSE